ncbi:MAG: chorismate mutase [Ruminiclostridium sp.]|nr:chorismate mutase [Ruminiclostridium sp.]
MDLNAIRAEIDKIDEELVKLFEKRSELACDVARYKKENNMEVFQKGREQFILDKVNASVSEPMKSSANILFTTIMDLSKCRQWQLLTEKKDFNVHKPMSGRPIAATVTKGSYSAVACEKFFDGKCDAKYVRHFEEVFEMVEKGEVDYGVLPIVNSTAGDVNDTYDLMGKHNFYICKTADIHISHVLAAKKGAKLSDIKTVCSHEMAIKQCSGFINENNLSFVEASTTAKGAQIVAKSEDTDCAAICSAMCAEMNGLEVIAENISDIKDNYTRFILFSNRLEVAEDASVISLSLTLPHTPGSLYRLLTRFSYCGLNLLRIESKPMPTGFADMKDEAFDFIFYLDFEGNIRNESVVKLLNNLEDEMKYYRFLGNYSAISEEHKE